MSDFQDEPSDAGDFGAPAPARPVRTDINVREIEASIKKQLKGVGIGLVGYPNSGKTSYLYSLKVGAAAHARGDFKWELVETGPEFAELTGTASDRQIATPEGFFKIGRYCKIRRRLIQQLPIGPVSMLCVPEVSGEIPKAIAGGTVPPSWADTSERYLTYLGFCDVLMCLVGLDGGRDGANTTAMRPDAALASAFNGLERIVGETTRRRKSKSELGVTILVTKVDLLRDHPHLDVVSLPADQSSIAALVTKGKRAWLKETIFGATPDRVRFSVNALIGAKEAGGDLDLQEAIAADFLKCHAPRSAKLLAALCKRPGVSVRFYLSAPYGKKFKIQGADRMPTAEEIRPTMVFEPLVDALERAWAANAGRRLRGRLAAAAVFFLLLLLLGPLWLWKLEHAFDATPASERWQTLEGARSSIESHPLHWMEQGLSGDLRAEHASRLLELRKRMLMSEDAASPKVHALEDQILSLLPDAVIEQKNGRRMYLRDMKSYRDAAWLLNLLDRGGKLEAQLVLTQEGTIDVCNRLAKFGLRTPPAIDDWATLQNRLNAIASGLEASPKGKLTIQCIGEGRPQLIAQIARVQALINAILALEALKAGRSTISAVELTDLAVAANEPLLLAEIDRSYADLVLKNWAEQKDALTTISSVVTALDASLKRTDVAPWVRDLLRQEAALHLEELLASIGRSISSASAAGQPARLRDLVAEVDAVSKSAENAWLLGEFAARVQPKLKSLLERADTLAKVSALPATDPLEGLATEVRRVFPGQPGEFKVEWARVGRPEKGRVDLSSLAQSQQSALEAQLRLRLVDAVKAPSLSASSVKKDMELVEVVCQDKSTRDLVEPIGKALLVRQRAAAPTLSEKDVKDFEDAAKSLAGNRSHFREFGKIALTTALADSPHINRLLETTITAIRDAQGIDEPEKRDWATDLAKRVGPKWAEFNAEDLVRTATALYELGAKPDEVVPMILSRHCELCVSPVNSKAGWEKSRIAVVKVLEAAMARGAREELAIEVLQPILRSVTEQLKQARDPDAFEAASQTDPARCIIELAGQNGATRLKGAVQALTIHTAAIRGWRLTCCADQQVACWISRKEWTEEELRSLYSTGEGKRVVDQLVRQDVAGRGRIQVLEGVLTFREGPAQESSASLRLGNQAEAELLAKAAGMRLPTAEELSALRGPAKPFGQGEDITELGIKGLNFGVREWVSGKPPVWGLSNSNSTPQQAQAAQIERAKDIGLRPALDLVPQALEALLRK